MLESMTGFGQSEGSIGTKTLKTEIKTLNSKFLDANIKLPRELSHFENDIRTLIQKELKRGKVNIQVDLSGGEEQPAQINENLLRSYYEKYKSLSAELGENETDLFKLALHSPEVISSEENKLDVDWADMAKIFSSAIKECQAFRKQEGASLQEKLQSYIDNIQQRLSMIEPLDKLRLENIRGRITKSMEELKERVQVDENRFEQELIYYIEKIDITEEKVRLQKHLDFFGEVLGSKTSEGKKLGFISQEIGREINTIGSKANDSDMQQLVVEMKDELEKIKEQLLNIL